MTKPAYYNVTRAIFHLLGLLTLFSFQVQAGPASFTESNRRMVVDCVDPQIGGETATRAKDGEPKTHTLTFQFSSNYQQASVIAGSRVPKTEDCTAIFNLASGVYTHDVMVDGELHNVSLQFTNGLSFSVVDFPLPLAPVPPEDTGETSLWRVINGTNEVFVGGVPNFSLNDFFPLAFTLTGIDYMRESDLPLPEGWEEAYDMSENLIVRTTPTQLSAAALTLQGVSLNLQTSLQDNLGDELYQELFDYFNDNFNLDIGGLPFRAHWMAELVTLLAVVDAGYVRGIETYFEGKAADDGLPVFALEEADDQIFAYNLNQIDGDPVAQITDALAEVNDPDFLTNVDAFLNAWRNGDESFIDDLLVEADRQDPGDFQRFYTDRYEIWLNAFADMLDSDTQEFVLLDIRYLVGVDSFLAYLEEQGYTVERY